MGKRMKFHSTPLAGVYLAESAPISDHRGALTRLYCSNDLAHVVGHRRIVQINCSQTRLAGAVRGMHLQYAPHAEMKLIRCLKGRVWDVAVDLRAGSPTFLQWHAQELSPQNGAMMVIPEGVAHGFQTLEPDSELLYLHTAAYEPSAEGGFSCSDDKFSIRWPRPILDLSARDASHPPIPADFLGITS